MKYILAFMIHLQSSDQTTVSINVAFTLLSS